MLEENIDKWRAKAVAEGIHARLVTPTQEQLDTWADRILDASSLAEVFNDH